MIHRSFAATTPFLSGLVLISPKPLAPARQDFGPSADPRAEMRASAARASAVTGPTVDIDTTVKRLIDQLVLDDPTRVHDAINALVEIGPRAVPAIIRRMDDRRDMKVRGISFVNPPQAFEGIRHYGVEKVVDALDDVPNHITGYSPGRIDTGVSIRRPADGACAGRFPGST